MSSGIFMGNNCANCLILRGDQDVIDEAESMFLDDNGDLDFSGILPLSEVTDPAASPSALRLRSLCMEANAMRTQRYRTEGEVRYDFDTILLPPVSWVTELSNLFPSLDIALAWCEPALDNLGQLVIRSGQQQERFDTSYTSVYEINPPEIQRRMPKPKQAIEDNHKWMAFELWEGGDPFISSEF